MPYTIKGDVRERAIRLAKEHPEWTYYRIGRYLHISHSSVSRFCRLAGHKRDGRFRDRKKSLRCYHQACRLNEVKHISDIEPARQRVESLLAGWNYPLTRRQRDFAEVLRTGPKTTDEIVTALNCKWRTAWFHLCRLRALGCVLNLGRRNYTRTGRALWSLSSDAIYRSNNLS